LLETENLVGFGWGEPPIFNKVDSNRTAVEVGFGA